MSNLLITICGRGGSKGVKGKNIRKLAGKPLIYYTIRQALDWGKAKRVVVSTDSEEIAKEAKKAGAEVPFMRPARLATDNAAKGPVICHALVESEKIFGETYDAVMDLDITSPIRTIADLDRSYKLFRQKNPKTLFSVVTAHRNPYFNMVEEAIDGRVKLSKKGNFKTRQSAPKVYDMNASIYIYDREFLMNKKNTSPFSNNTIIYEMDDLSRTDIDSEVDFKFIEFLVKEGLVKL